MRANADEVAFAMQCQSAAKEETTATTTETANRAARTATVQAVAEASFNSAAQLHRQQQYAMQFDLKFFISK